MKTKETDRSLDTADPWIDHVREKIYEDTKNMTPEQRMEYIRKGGESFRQEMARRRASKEQAESESK